MRLPEHWETLAGGGILLGVALWALTGGGPRATWPAGSEDLQPESYPAGLPSEYFHWSPVTWAGRRHPYPAGWCGRLPGLIDRQMPDYADRDS